ncbi:MAG: acyl carrier protein [Gammaproteobacteria bacterium]|nr:acyl carrier protein [Gammaproteobacteria bacterium]NIR81734.1 acyl carrier protein [Gammaproteobacteria bacterium]NIR88537.1 acyl carrier protein [Gammaproteobacteria bacterium]NIU02841.1 acyl carrier protein [Gammaproteobacteria bacterium]NIV50363.1 acyl carrier protein [Gammaproteobacteria bacterium]
MKPAISDIEAGLVELLREMTAEWDLDLDEIGPHTLLSKDLCFTSIDALNLMASIDMKYSRRLNYESLILADGKYVEDLSVTDIARFVHNHFDDEVGDEPEPM